ncbi:MAG: PilN domain-containing protein [Patescibacteria group bacterium]
MINLLPLTEKEKIYQTLLRKQFQVFGVLLVLVVFGGVFFVLNTWVFLKIQTRELGRNLNIEMASPESETTLALENEVRELNVKLSKYQNFRAEEVAMVALLGGVSETIPAGIALKSLSLDTVVKRVTLAGEAKVRDDIVEMEKRLKKSDFFEKIESPIGNYLQKNNGSFNFSFYIKSK